MTGRQEKAWRRELSEVSFTVEAVLRCAGLDAPVDRVVALRDGTPGFVLRVSPVEARHDGEDATATQRDSVIVKTFPSASKEPEVTDALSKLLDCVPRVLRIADGVGFRVMVMEDLGPQGLYLHPSVASYMAAVDALAALHRRLDGVRTLFELVPTYGRTEWESTVAEAARLTAERLTDGAYAELELPVQRRLAHSLDPLLQRSQQALGSVWGQADRHGLPLTLVHGDFHEGNIIVRDGTAGASGLGVVDWGDARWDSGLFDLASLIDVSSRMKTIDLDESRVLQRYLAARAGLLSEPSWLASEWNLAWILRAWSELRWFAESGEDFGERAAREMRVIERRLAALT